MRILYHHRTLADGAEGVHIAAMVEAFRSLGHEVVIAHAPGEAISHRRRRVVEAVRSAVPRGAFELASIAYNAIDYVRLRREVQRVKPDFLYVRHSRFDMAALDVAASLGVPSVLEVNALFSTLRYSQHDPIALPGLARSIEKRALRRAGVVIAVSSPLAQDVHALSGTEALVLPNGADPGKFDRRLADGSAIRARFELDFPLVAGWTGIIRSWHGLELLLDAVAAVPDAALLIVGDGPGRAELETRARAMGLDARLRITGRVDHAQIVHYIGAMDVAIVADERTGVASPMKLLEYMAMGRPVIVPRQPNLQDLIEDEVDGLMFEPGSASELGARLGRLASDPALRMRLGRKAREKIERERNWRAIAAEVLAAVARTKSVG